MLQNLEEFINEYRNKEK